MQLFTYAEAVLESVPAHLRNVKEYELQFVFHADGWFLVHCITTLLKNGKLKKPTVDDASGICIACPLHHTLITAA